MQVDQSLAVLTRADSSFGIKFLNKLALQGVKPKLLCVEYTPFSKKLKKAKFLASKIGWRDSLRYNMKFWWPILQRKISFGYLHKLPKFHGLAENVIACSNINDFSVVEALSDDSITKIVLAQSGIIRKKIINLNKWIINCHPGQLPDFRGVDVIRWALLERKPIQVTLHLVDTGIDTGSILYTEIIPVVLGDSVNAVIDKAINKSIDILVDAAITEKSLNFNILYQEKNQGKQYYLMPFKIAQQLEKDWDNILKYYLENYSNGQKL